MTEPALVRERRGNVLVARINRPAARNAISAAVMQGIAEAVQEAEGDAEIRALVVTGTGEQAFCAGIDLRAMAAGEGAGTTPEYTRLVAGHVTVPVLAAVNGVAVGAGFELALGADIVVASAAASFGLPEVKRGLFSGSGVLTAPKRLPLGIALELALTGERMSASRLHELGFVNRLVPQDDVLDAALAMAELIAANAPLGLAASKELVRLVADRDPSAEARHAELTAEVFGSEDAREGAAAFMEKRDPTWKGR